MDYELPLVDYFKLDHLKPNYAIENYEFIPLMNSSPIPSKPKSIESASGYFSHFSESIFDPSHPNYAWKYRPLQTVSNIFVPIDDNGATIKFTQFRPSKDKPLINYNDELRRQINLDWDELNCEIWVFYLPIYNFNVWSLIVL